MRIYDNPIKSRNLPAVLRKSCTSRKHQSRRTGNGKRCSTDRTPAVVAGRADKDDLAELHSVAWQMLSKCGKSNHKPPRPFGDGLLHLFRLSLVKLGTVYDFV